MTNLFFNDDAYHGGAFMLSANYGFLCDFQAAEESDVAGEAVRPTMLVPRTVTNFI